MDPRIARWAKTLVEYCLEVKPGESVQINATSVAEPLVTAVYREIVRAGGHPVPAIRIPALAEVLMLRATMTSCSGSIPPTAC